MIRGGRWRFFGARERQAQKKHESTKKKEREKNRKRRARKKKARIRTFSSPTVEIWFQSPKLLGRGKARVLSKTYSSVGVLNLCPILAVIF
jgi:hypothetical protein